MKLSDLKSGDKATVQIEVITNTRYDVYVNIGGEATRNCVSALRSEEIEVHDVIRKLDDIAVGQVWQRNATSDLNRKVKIIFVDGKTVLYETVTGDAAVREIGIRNISNIITFKQQFILINY